MHDFAKFRPAPEFQQVPAAYRHSQQRTLKGLTIGVAKETVEGEKRVVITPQNVTQLRKKGAEVFVQEGAGAAAGFSDAMYAEAGAKITNHKDVWSKELTLKVIDEPFNRLRDGTCACVCVCGCACTCARAHACVRVSACMRVCARVCVGVGVGAMLCVVAAGARGGKEIICCWRQINRPTDEEAAQIGTNKHLSLLQSRLPEGAAVVDKLASQGATAVFDLSMLLRTLSRGQAFDVISSQVIARGVACDKTSAVYDRCVLDRGRRGQAPALGRSSVACPVQANISGYRAVIDAAYNLQRPYAGQMTAAGRLQPSKVMVVGAGVAGLAAIQQAKNMAAVVTAFDVRAAAKEQVGLM
jgi:hypothetical protein